MQEQGCDASVIATSSSTPTWWELHSTYPHSSWAHHMMNNIPWNPSNNHTSNTSREEDISISTSFTNAGSNQSGLTAVDSPHQELVESSASADLLGETASDSHLWNQVLLYVHFINPLFPIDSMTPLKYICSHASCCKSKLPRLDDFVFPVFISFQNDLTG